MIPEHGRFRTLLEALSLPLLIPGAIAGAGCLAGQWLTVDLRADGGVYAYLTYGLLAVGLYGSAHGISRPEARSDVYRIVVAITFGVIVKAAFIAAVLALLFRRQPEYLVLAVAMAQIDPLSVSAMLESRDMSPRAKSLLAAWASFDDPVTTVLVVSISSIALTGADSAATGTAAYAQTLVENLGLLLVAAAVWAVVRRRGRTGAPDTPVGGVRRAVQITALVVLMAAATWQFLMLGLALSALFFRPPLGRWIGRTTNLALFVATFLLGVLLARGMDLRVGVVLGVATFVAQIAVGAVVSWGFSRRDRASLCLSQQNGITAIILALLLEPLLPETVAVIAPAIFVVNVLHLTSNSLLGAARQHAEKAQKGPEASDMGTRSDADEAMPVPEVAVTAPPLEEAS
jgi:hypothetical protein